MNAAWFSADTAPFFSMFALLAVAGALIIAPILFDLPRLNRIHREAELRSTIDTDL